MTINLTAAPTAPSLNDPANFNTRALALFQWLTGTLITELEGLDAADFFSVLGTVSQSGGVPTGDLFEKGSNANGEYVRFADGTQICWHTGSVTTTITGAFFGGFRSGTLLTWTFPASFSGTPTGIMGNVTGTSDGFGVVALGAGATTCNFAFTSVTSQASNAARSARMTAIGRWF